MLNHMASLAMSTSVLEALPGKIDIKRHSPNIIYLCVCIVCVLVSFSYSAMSWSLVMHIS